jgi:Glycosyltransferase sugar-binding region containing DXD motif
MIPNQFHLVFGMTPDFGGKPWGWVHHRAVEMAWLINKPDKIYIWFTHEPSGPWWEETKKIALPVAIASPACIFGRPLIHPAHKADVVRLQKLIDYGGYYIDCDVWCLKPFSELVSCGTWLGQQGGHGLCNATIGAEKDSWFLKYWLSTYVSFRSRGRDRFWSEHSVKKPVEYAQAFPDTVTVFDNRTFFYPLWDNTERLFTEDNGYLKDSYSVHLWETYTWGFLKDLTPEKIIDESEFGRIFNGIPALRDELGQTDYFG